MGFLLRIGFWFSLVLLAIPLDTGADNEESVGAIQTLLAAKSAIGDITSICDRQPDVCEVGKSAMHTVGVRAREAARIAYQVLDRNFGEAATVADGVDSQAPDTQTVTGGIADIIEDAEPAAPRG